ncbi:F-box only protein 41-like [Sinocyclocheilus grahami]|uniref:F-box only protein 41-like n=1 Tax=Sinocyclocheilus grahami TaxID=75366 RepID=UPI0007ACF567|nr:PREDICTED: F-box only protein 41-like [Sinocyclocheilus grahami]
MASLDLPYRCPRCGENKRFRSLSSLRAHLEYNHTYETLYVLSKSNSVCDAAALLPLVADGALSAKSCFPYRELPCSGEELELAPSSTACYLPNVEFPLGEILVKTAMSSGDALSSTGNNAVAVAANVAASAVEAAYEEGLARLKARAFERLELDERLEKLSEEVEQKIAARVGRLQTELERKSLELEKAKLESERLSQEKQDLEDKATELSRQVDVSVEMLASLKQDLVNKEQELSHKQQEVGQIDQFLQETAAREANAKVRLQQFIEDLLDRADRAEKQLQIISSCATTPNGSLGHCSLQGSKPNGQQRNSSISGASRGMYQVSDQRSSPSTAVKPACNLSAMQKICGKSPLLFSVLAGRSEGGYKPCRHEKSPSKVNEVISPEVLKIRAALFCIFTYLDMKTLLRAAEVCRDWKFVARHPAVWTRVLLENARISSKFLCTLSQWCTQMHSLILQNLKPRQRGKKETKEEYLKSTRGCLEEGLEALLKATGSNLLILKVSHCPNLLTDRSLWLASCYCRALQAVTYRSATDPVGQEVIWALGAGCRDIISLQVAPLHPCQQPARFSNRCLQTIGRCWPHLRALGVGGAGCGIQGLASLARNCMRLQVLELDHVSEINQEVAAEMCREGLKGLEMLVLTSTPVTPKALLHFNSACRNLKSIVVQIGIEDYFEDPNSPEARKLFDEMVNKLQALKKRPGFSKILHVKADGLC